MLRRAYLAFPLILLCIVLHFYYLHRGTFALYADEAQYWSWAQQFSYGYYSKPPMIAWLISLTTSMCGETEFCIRFSSPILHGLTAMMIFLIGRELYNHSVAFWSSLVYITMPAVIVSSGIISTDPALLFFWSTAIFCFIKAVRTDRLHWWAMAGIAAGLGCLSKYNMLIFLPSAILFLLLSKEKGIAILKSGKFYLACVLTALMYLPNLIWNINNQFVSYAHTQQISGLDKALVHPDELALFLLAQAGVFGPLLFILLLRAFAGAKKLIKIEEEKLLLCFIVPFFLTILAISFLSKAQANWAAPMYVAATILVVAYAQKQAKMIVIYASVMLHVAVAGLYYNHTSLMQAAGITLHAKTGSVFARDPFYRLKGWRELGDQISMILKQHPNAVLLSDERKILAELLYYVTPHPFNARKWTKDGIIKDNYDLTRSFSKEDGDEFILISRNRNESTQEILDSFVSAREMDEIIIPLYPDYQLRYQVYHLKQYKK